MLCGRHSGGGLVCFVEDLVEAGQFVMWTYNFMETWNTWWNSLCGVREEKPGNISFK